MESYVPILLSIFVDEMSTKNRQTVKVSITFVWSIEQKINQQRTLFETWKNINDILIHNQISYFSERRGKMTYSENQGNSKKVLWTNLFKKNYFIGQNCHRRSSTHLQARGPACHPEAHHCLRFTRPVGSIIVTATKPLGQCKQEAGATHADLLKEHHYGKNIDGML